MQGNKEVGNGSNSGFAGKDEIKGWISTGSGDLEVTDKKIE